MAGPWFTVHRSEGDWQKLDQIWISNGTSDCRGRIEMRMTLVEPEPDILSGTELSLTQ